MLVCSGIGLGKWEHGNLHEHWRTTRLSCIWMCRYVRRGVGGPVREYEGGTAREYLCTHSAKCYWRRGSTGSCWSIGASHVYYAFECGSMFEGALEWGRSGSEGKVGGCRLQALMMDAVDWYWGSGSTGACARVRTRCVYHSSGSISMFEEVGEGGRGKRRKCRMCCLQPCVLLIARRTMRLGTEHRLLREHWSTVHVSLI